MGAGPRNTLVGVAAALYAASLALPTAAPFNPRFSGTVYPGWDAFQTGWWALVAFEPNEPDWWVLGGAWLVNPLVWVAAVATLAGRRRAAGWLAWAAVSLCLPALVQFGGMIAGQPGYWCWLASAVLLAAGSCRRWAARTRPQPQERFFEIVDKTSSFIH
jgi:hypothetical protein